METQKKDIILIFINQLGEYEVPPLIVEPDASVNIPVSTQSVKIHRIYSMRFVFNKYVGAMSVQ